MIMDERFAHRHITESVEVPSSEHVAEIVGRQGCKIKALRAKTSTYIRSPPRGEEPVFMITGRPEDVMEAKREIELAAEHFTQIRASRRHSQGGCAPGHITAYVRVPLRVVGLVVGPKGATIKRIQQESHTYIVTPSREREPIFEVTGLPHNVESARREIEQHIYQRTGNMPMTDPSASIQTYEMAALAATNIPRMNNVNGYSTLSQQQQPLQQQSQMRQISGYGNEFCGVENMYRSGLRSSGGLKAYSASGSPPPFYGATEMMPSQQQQSNGMPLRTMINNENIYNPQSWQQSQPQPQQQFQQQQSCNSRLMFNESSLFNDFLPNPRANSFGSTNNYLNNINNNSTYLCSLSSSSRDEGLGDSPSSTYNKFNHDAFHMLSSIWGDVDTSSTSTTTAGNNKAVDTGLAPQIATA
jgi:RNA-binding protein MEX3